MMVNRNVYICYFSLLTLIIISPNNVQGKVDFVTCGSVLKLLNVHYKVRLHSHEIQYASGSGQQSVTGTEAREDTNSHWVVRGGKPACSRGAPVKCKGEIRLTHLVTSMNLQASDFPSPLSRGMEIAAKDGDEGLWRVMCDGGFWRRSEEVMLRHVSSDVYLAVSGDRFGHPIQGQYEIVGIRESVSAARWTVSEGVFIHPPETKKRFYNEHLEL